MSMIPPQAGTPSWMMPFADPGAWEAWISQVQGAVRNATAESSQDPGLLIDPAEAVKLQNDYVAELTSLWQDFMAAKAPAVKDKRFSGEEWQANYFSTFNAATYLLNTRFLMAMAEAVKAPPRVKQKIRFAVQQVADAMSPANFLVTNPEAQQKLLETKGESLTKGIAHLLEDARRGRISQSDESAFEVGRNVATTPGAVVFENELFQLIQYKPATKTVYKRPLLLVPPCINKYYILDLQPSNSLVRYSVEQGHTVFLVSWCNPDASLGHLTWDDYVESGVIQAIKTVQDISEAGQINALGFCVGGTLLSTALAVLAARGQKPVESLTLLTTLLDFSDTGVLDVFIDEAQVSMREKAIGQGGLMPGREFVSAFSSLRQNDLVWNYVRSNYLKGENPPPFDLLYWNADSTNLPGPMFCWYLRNMYLENNLIEPGKLTVAGEKIDLSRISLPAFIYGSREDHIVPWTAAFESTRLINPKKRKNNRFVLGASGHIAGVINPPAKNKRSYWTNEKTADTAEEWIAEATEHPGSWWGDWTKFLAKHAGSMVDAPARPGNATHPEIEPAPGRYVKVKAG